jgi:hypothetical protein
LKNMTTVVDEKLKQYRSLQAGIDGNHGCML